MADTAGLYDAHRDAIFRYLCRAIGQTEPARDLTQEVFLRIARSPVPDADAGGLRAWVFTIARNVALNHLRDGRRRGDGRTVPADGVAPAVQELAVAMEEALAELSDCDRDVFLLREMAGLHYDEIAAACGISVEAVRARLKRARQTLRASLDGPVRVHRLRPMTLRGPRTGDS